MEAADGRAAQIARSIKSSTSGPCCADRGREHRDDLVLRLIGRPHDRIDDQVGVHQLDHVPFVAREGPGPGLAPMPHLRVAQRGQAVDGDPAANAALPGGRDPAPDPALIRGGAPLPRPARAGPPRPALCRDPRLNRSTSAKRRASASACAAGSLQSISRAALRLAAPSTVTPASRSTCSRGIPASSRHTWPPSVTHGPTNSTYLRRGPRPATARNRAPRAVPAIRNRRALWPTRPSGPRAADPDRGPSAARETCSTPPAKTAPSSRRDSPTANCQRWSTRAVTTASASPT